MIEEIRNKIANALRLLYSSYNEVATIDIEINRTTNKTHGDLYTNIAMKLAKIVKKNPLDIAEEIRDHITINDEIVKIESVAPGYINFFISTKNKYDQIHTILNSKDDLIKNVENIDDEYIEKLQELVLFYWEYKDNNPDIVLAEA